MDSARTLFSNSLTSSLRFELDKHTLRLFPIRQRVDTKLATKTGLFVSAKWLVERRRGTGAVHAYSAGLQSRSDAQRPVNVLAEDSGVETELRIVRTPYRLFLRLKRVHHRHRAEDLLSRDPRRIRHIREDGGIDEIARHTGRITTEQDLSLSLPDLEVLLDLVVLNLVDLGSVSCVLVECAAGGLGHGLDGRLIGRKELVANRVMDVDSGARDANLACVL